MKHQPFLDWIREDERKRTAMMRLLALPCAAAFGLSLLAACAGDVNPVRDLVVGVGAGPPAARTPDFVEKTRPASVDYIPVGTAAAARPTKARTADEVKAAEADPTLANEAKAALQRLRRAVR